MSELKDWLGLGLEPKDLEMHHVCLRAVIVFFVTLTMARLADKRFLAKLTPFDVILSLVLASVLSRAVNGSAPFFPTIVSAGVLVALHRIIGRLATWSDTVGSLVKGNPDVIVKDGQMDERRMWRKKISFKDLTEEARLNGKTENIEEIRLATLERNGEISILLKK